VWGGSSVRYLLERRWHPRRVNRRRGHGVGGAKASPGAEGERSRVRACTTPLISGSISGTIPLPHHARNPAVKPEPIRRLARHPAPFHGSPRRRGVSRFLSGLGLLVFLGVPAAAIPAAAQDAQGILVAASERHQELRGFCADFRQVVVNDILRQTTRSRGELCQDRSDRFEMRFTDPDGDRVVADGRYIWIYLPSTDPGQVFQTDLNGRGGQFDLHREFLSDPGERYRPTLEGREDMNGRTTHVLALEPTGSSPFLRARVWIDVDDFMLRKVELTEDEGFVRTVQLSGIRLNPTIPAERFRFEPPPGVQVIHR